MQSSDSIPLFFSSEFPENQFNLLLINEDTKEKQIIRFYNPSFADDVSFGMYNLIYSIKQLGYPMQCCMIFWFNFERNQFIYVGNDPIPDDLYIYFTSCTMGKAVLKYRKTFWQKNLDDELYGQVPKIEDFSMDTNPKKKPGRRANERLIGKAIEKVGMWRNLFSSNANMNLDMAAERVGISKKTLDDYLMQIRIGKKYGFNFNKHQEDKMGVLRKFNRMNMASKEQEKKE